jgi:hypothetical protein
MYNGRYINYTYGADGQLYINNEKQWGVHILNNNAEHIAVQSKMKDLKKISNDAKMQAEYFQNQNQKQSNYLSFLNSKLHTFNNISKNQEYFYTDKIHNQYLNYSQIYKQQENICNTTLDNQQNHFIFQQNLLEKQQSALQHFENLHKHQVISNLDIEKKHNQIIQNYPEYFTEDIHHDPPVYHNTQSNLDLSTITSAPRSNNAPPTIISTNNTKPNKSSNNQKLSSKTNVKSSNSLSVTNFIKKSTSSIKNKATSIKNKATSIKNRSMKNKSRSIKK